MAQDATSATATQPETPAATDVWIGAILVHGTFALVALMAACARWRPASSTGASRCWCRQWAWGSPASG